MSQADPLNCYVCKALCIAKEDKNYLFGFRCDCCSRPICKNCSGVKTATEIRCILLKDRISIIWCPNCKKSSSNHDDDSQHDLNVSQDQTHKVELDYLKRLLKEVEEKSDLLKVTNDLLLKRINTLEKDIQVLEREKELVRSQQSPIYSPVPNVSASVEEYFREREDRENRKRNFILFNSPETNESIDETKATILQTMECCVPDHEHIADDIKVYRLGKQLPNKTRPIKVICNSYETAVAVKRNSGKLRLNPNFKHLIIREDKTLRQLDEYRSLKQQLVERVNQGERNLKIVTVNGSYKIVTTYKDNPRDNLNH